MIVNKKLIAPAIALGIAAFIAAAAVSDLVDTTRWLATILGGGVIGVCATHVAHYLRRLRAHEDPFSQKRLVGIILIRVGLIAASFFVGWVMLRRIAYGVPFSGLAPLGVLVEGALLFGLALVEWDDQDLLDASEERGYSLKRRSDWHLH